MQLAPSLEGLLQRLVGPDSVLSRLMAGASRSSVDIVEAYNLETLAHLGDRRLESYTEEYHPTYGSTAQQPQHLLRGYGQPYQ